MCGLIGGQVPEAEVESVLPSIAHRGPDDSGTWTNGRVTLGHVRLAVQDLSGSQQPFSHGGIVLTYNGEMWSPEEAPLSRRAGEAGDTGPLARALAGSGVSILPKLRGMFALAWTTSDGDTYLARDTYGEIPLHYGYRRDGGMVWASEIAPLLKLGAVAETVRWFPPGHYLHLPAEGAPTLVRWAEALPSSSASGSDQMEKFGAHLRRAIESRLTSDVPVAALLSGGLDSATIIGGMIRSGIEVHPYIAVHDDRSVDLRRARQVAEHFELSLTEVRVSPTRKVFEAAVGAAEMPHKAQVEIASACLPLAQALRSDGVRVVLSGEGSDELWASYGMAYHGIKKLGWDGYRGKVFTDQHRKNFARVNKVFMAHGVEARMPFLEPGLVRHALSLTRPEVTQHESHPKAFLAEVAQKQFGVPADVALQTKRAFQTDARLDLTAARIFANPAAVYRQKFTELFPGVKP